MSRPKLSVYWASSCGGCEVAVLNLHDRILDVDQAFDLVFCPCLLDTKIEAVEAMADGEIALTLFNGAIRTAENEEMALLLRRKSRLLIAFGACAAYGGIPALSNFHARSEHLRAIYLEGPTLDNPAGVIPRESTDTPQGALRLPAFFERVKTLRDVVEVDYSIPGCPPESAQIWNVIEAIVGGRELPPKGSVLGAGLSSVCDECARVRTNRLRDGFHRTFEIETDPEKCLLDQGIVCMGVATRSGCGALCPQVNMPCAGCYGPPEGVQDQGARMVAALGSILDPGGYQGVTPEQLAEKVDGMLRAIPDGAGVYYKFGAAGSILAGGRNHEANQH
jgi:F420-non-reducing hydrogenase small subunit